MKIPFLTWLLAALDVVEATAWRDRRVAIEYFNSVHGLASLHHAWKRGESPRTAAGRVISYAIYPTAS